MTRRFDTVFRNIQVFETTIDFPSVGSNGTVFIDAAVTLPQGTSILAFEPITDATSIDDMILQVFVPVANVMRFTLNNNTAGAIDPVAITFRIVTGEVNPDIAVVV